MSFDEAYEKVLGHEGGYVFDPKDSGGETICGISRRFHPEWSGWPIMDNVKKIYPESQWTQRIMEDRSTMLHVKMFYRSKYWDALRLDEMPAQLRLELFDSAINMGKKTAVMMLQRTLNVLNRQEQDYQDLDVDGALGSKSINAAHASRDLNTVLVVLNCLQGAYYVEIAERSPKNERFMRGWINNRVNI